jgi:membrane associated rhomboid family serine protease
MRRATTVAVMFGFRRPAPPADPVADRLRLRTAVRWSLLGVTLLWVVAGVQAVGRFDWVGLGVYPRAWHGLPGIITAPLVHGSWGHLLANSSPLLALGIAALYGFPRATRRAVPLIWIGSGLGVWLFARESFHIGASGLSHGLMFFTVVIGLMRRDALSVALALVVLFLYGSMVWGVLPQRPGVSFEYHLFGAVVGVCCGLFLSRLDPLPRYQRYSWEDEASEEDEEPGTGEPGHPAGGNEHDEGDDTRSDREIRPPD